MIFSVQRFLEDNFERRGLADVDQYAIRVANVFERLEAGSSEKILARELGRIRTAFFRRNQSVKRKEFESKLALTLWRRFPKKKVDPAFDHFENTLGTVRRRLRGHRRSLSTLLSEFKLAVEARAVDAFWISRKRNALRSKPEKIAQGLLAVFAKGVIGSSGLVLREFASGIGFVDVGISFSRLLHPIELKILKGKLTGANQLATYMRTEGTRNGWLVLIDVRRNSCREVLPTIIHTAGGAIRTLTIDINPLVPHLR